MQQSNRYVFLDSSRGLAALIVFLIHFIRIFTPGILQHKFAHSPLAFLIDGDAAVLYFFVLSGYVLARSLESTTIDLSSYTKFIGRRILRIYPAFLFALILTLSLFPLYSQTTSASWLNAFWKSYPGTHGMWTQAILIYRIPNDPAFRLLPHDWTLSVEMLLSIFLPLMVLFSRKFAWLSPVLGYLAVKLLPIDPFIFDFSFGVFIAFQTEYFKSVWKKMGILGHVTTVVLAVLLIELETLSGEIGRISELILIHHKSWGMAVLLIAILSSEKAQNLLSTKVLNLIGKISFSFYLFHFIVLAILYQNSSITNPSVLFLIGLAASLVISGLSYLLIERPFQILSKKWLKA